MSTFEREGYEWRETYLLFFPSDRRPTLATAAKRLKEANPLFEIEDGVADEDGLLESVTVVSQADFAAVDICFDDGEDNSHQAEEIARGFPTSQLDPDERKKIAHLPNCDARFDLLHFGRVVADDAASDGDDDLLDPSTLLAVIEVMMKLTSGVGIDPASGTLV